jgi:uncharacterized membrane protein
MLKQLRHSHPRLLIGTAVGLVAYPLLPDALGVAMRLVLAWDLGIIVFLVLASRMMARSTAAKMRYRARLEDENAWVIVVVVFGAALASLAAIGFVLHDAKDTHGWVAVLDVALSSATILLSWTMAHTMVALHYAHAFYDDPDSLAAGVEPAAAPGGAIEGGLAFPGEEHPDYWDFLYFSFVIGMTCQVSDVQITSRPMRRLALAHGSVAFLFNTVILALCINLVAGLL